MFDLWNSEPRLTFYVIDKSKTIQKLQILKNDIDISKAVL